LDQHNLMVPTKRDLEGKLSTKLRKQPLVSNYMMWIVLLLVASGTVYTYISSQRILSLAAGDNLATLGVLPFDISDLEETDEVLLASFTDEVITDLSALEGMRVISPEASAKIKIHADKPTRELAETMGVTHLLRGEVKKVSNEMTLEVELVDARTGKNKWKHLFHKPFEHLSSVKRDISREIAVKLDASENPFLAEVSRKTASYKVMELYRKARNAASDRTEEGLLRSKAFLERSVAMDDSFALGFAGLSQCYSLMKVYDLIDPDSALFYASENAGKAFKLDRDLAEAYTADALKDYTFFLNDSKDIYELCQHAIQLKPSYDYAYHLIGKVLFDAEHYSEAKSYFNYALRLNPYEYVYQKMTARASEHMGDLEHAEEGYLKLLSNYPENEDALSALIKFYVNHQNWAQVEKYVTEHKDTFGQLCSELYISTQQGSLDIAEKRLETLREKYPERTFAALEASFFDRKGHTDAALKILKEAAYQKQDWIKELKLMPLSDAIRDDSTYLSILEIVKLDSEVIL
ncbi:MAG: hypothetical protein OEQ53_05795, partial [Saprospiraceae bacterium]|nr:hypothetical protein [Saprospiraceae bacterium]